MHVRNLQPKVNFVNKHGLRTDTFYALAENKFETDPKAPIKLYYCVSINQTRFMININDGFGVAVSKYSENTYFQELPNVWLNIGA